MNRSTSIYASRPTKGVVMEAGALAEGMSRGELEVWYQPQLDLANGALSRFEALVRWRHPRLGLLMPDDFLPAAEVSEEIALLGEFVLSEAVAQMADWRELAPEAGLGVAVNLSATEALDSRLPDAVDGVLDAHGVPAELLCVELAEASLMNPAVEDTVRRLGRRGVQIAVDDFGSGFSSLSRLRRLRTHYLKIDLHLVAGLGGNPDDTVVVEAIVQMAHTLGMRAVAEGVETLDQLGRLSELGCDFAQGFYWSKAMLSEDARRLVSRVQASV